jgi:hypothetical protein
VTFYGPCAIIPRAAPMPLSRTRGLAANARAPKLDARAHAEVGRDATGLGRISTQPVEPGPGPDDRRRLTHVDERGRARMLDVSRSSFAGIQAPSKRLLSFRPVIHRGRPGGS